MIELYVKLVKEGKRKIENIPEKHREEVRAKVNA